MTHPSPTETARTAFLLDDEELLERFRHGSLGADEFPHREHVRMAWLYLQRWPLPEVLDRFPTDLKRFAEGHGASGLFHATITWAWLFLVDERRRAMPRGHDWGAFADAHDDLVRPQGNPLLRYYRAETLASEAARSAFVMPDRGLEVGEPASTG